MDGRKRNNRTGAARREAIYRRRRRKLREARRRSRLEAAKTVLRRTHSAVYDAEIDDPRFAGWVRVGSDKYRPREVLKMASEILKREKARRKELLAQYGVRKR